jgi:hypothetical protein
VSRASSGAAGTYPTLAEACAAAAAGRETVIEIDDNGPLFVPSLPAVTGRSLALRAAKGCRPLLAWDTAVQAGPADRLLEVRGGNLSLENLDVVVKWQDARAAGPAALFRVEGGNLAARGCTFATAGKHPQGMAVARLDGGPGKCLLSHCFARGSDLVALDVRGLGADVLADGCLLVGGEPPLLQVAGSTDAPTTVRVVRSTLVAGKTLLRLRRSGAAYPALNWLGWDALLTRTGPQDGALLVLADKADVTRVEWRAVNCLYAGWKDLLAGPESVPASALAAWQRLWHRPDGDVAIPQTLRAVPLADPEEEPPGTFDTARTPAWFAATSGPGVLGCDLAALPPARDTWLRLTCERFTMPPLALPDGKPPEVPAGEDGYQGEELDLNQARVDLGDHLERRLKNARPGSRVVVHLTGSGEKETSPLRFKDIHLVLYVAPPRGNEEPLRLMPGRSSAGREALFEAEGGSLELIGVRVRCDNDNLGRLPAYLVKVRGGDLRLCDCRLLGPLDKPPPNYRGLVRLEGSGDSAPDRARTCAVNRSVLQSGQALLHVTGAGARVRVRQSVLVAVDDVLRLDPEGAAAARLNVQCLLEQNTVAARRGVVRLGDAPKLPAAPAEPMVVLADHNVFLDPFSEGPRQSSLLRYEGRALARGLFIWQGQGNVYDQRRLHACAAPAEGPAAAQPMRTWEQFWGSFGEQQARLLDRPPGDRSTFSVSNPQLRLLALPAQFPLKPGEVEPGADLDGLGLLKRQARP